MYFVSSKYLIWGQEILICGHKFVCFFLDFTWCLHHVTNVYTYKRQISTCALWLFKKKNDRESEIMVGARWRLKKMVWNKFRLQASVQFSTFFDWLYYFFFLNHVQPSKPYFLVGTRRLRSLSAWLGTNIFWGWVRQMVLFGSSSDRRPFTTCHCNPISVDFFFFF